MTTSRGLAGRGEARQSFTSARSSRNLYHERSAGALGDRSTLASESPMSEESPVTGAVTAAGSWPLEPDESEIRAMLEITIERIVAHLGSLPEQPAHGTQGAAEVARRYREPLPETPSRLDDLLRMLFEEAVPRSFNTAGPGYLAYIPGGGLFDSAVASLIADSVNRYVGVFAAAPVLSQLEANVVRWFGEMIGYPETARGFLTSGGSLANFSALVTARRERLPEDFLRGIVYVSDQTHHSVLKAALLAGLPVGNVRMLPSDAQFRLRPADLEAAIAEDRAASRIPFLVVGSAGTTNTGAIDPLDEIADVAQREGLWFHVDAAYGGFFVLIEEARAALAGLERADSVVLDPHKALFLPYGSGCLLVRDGAALMRAHSVRADYMPPMQQDDDLVDFCEISPELSRGFRGLKVWLPLRLRGVEVFREALREKWELARWATERLREIPDVEIVAEPQVSVVGWRLRPNGLDEGQLNRLNRKLLDRINARNRVYLTPTMARQAFIIRICVLSFRTHLDRMQMALEDVRAAIDEVRSGEAGGGA